MGQKWDYAELSKMAKSVGGPEKFVELLENASRVAGRREMIPIIGCAMIVSSAFTVGTIKLMDYIKDSKQSTKNEIISAKEEIINGIRECDKEQVNKEEE